MKDKASVVVQGIPQLLQYFLVNQALCSAFRCLSQWSEKRNFTTSIGANGFPLTRHNMPASVNSQLLNKGIPEQIWPDFKHFRDTAVCPSVCSSDLCSAQLYGGKVSPVNPYPGRRLPNAVPALNNLTLWRTSFSGDPAAIYLRRPRHLRVATETAFCAAIHSRYWPGEPSVGQGCSDSGSHFQPFHQECLRNPAFRPREQSSLFLRPAPVLRRRRPLPAE